VEHLIASFEADWLLARKAKHTVKMYSTYLKNLFAESSDPTALDVKNWLTRTESLPVRRKRAQAVRAFGKWAELNELEVFVWWRTIPVAKDKVSPQLTVTEEMYRDALTKAKNARDKALIEVLWSTGLRRSEIARLEVGDINLSQGYLIIRTTKAGKPRIAPLSPHARRALLRLVGKRLDGSVFELNSSSIRVRLARLGLPSAHAWRRGWAVHALRNGISEASVRAAAGWSSGAMVVRYTNSLSGELALEEFQRVWQPKHP
jgi:integrase